MSNYTVANSKQNNSKPSISMVHQYKPTIIPSSPQNEIPITDPIEKKVKWGPAVWYALHTLSVKVKEDSFQTVRKDLLEMIYMTCIHLPCPDCANHAKEYLDKMNFNNIKTKEDLKVMLFQFHNDVNKRKGYEQFPYEKIDEMYSKANTVPVLQNFLAHFQDRKYRSIKLLATDLHRNLLSNDFKKWLNINMHHFDI
jgi:hypothetical protein